jgi:hypothetical protein
VSAGVTSLDRLVGGWGVSTRTAVAIAAAPVVVTAALAFSATTRVFWWLNGEDRSVEWLQFISLAVATVLFAVVAVRFSRTGVAAAVLAWFVTLALFFVAGEEISWGQRVFGWGTPERLEHFNYQGETTIHNVGGLHAFFVYAVAIVGLYGVVAPIAWSLFADRPPRTPVTRLLVPPLFLAPYFAMPFVYRFVRLLLEPERWFPRYIGTIVEFAEITELCLYFGVALFGLLLWRMTRRPSGSGPALSD